MTLRLLPLLFCYVLLCACSGNGEWRDDGIAPGIQQEIARANRQVMEAIRTNDPHLLPELTPVNIKGKQADSIYAFIHLLHNRFNVDSYSVRRRFYIRDHKGYTQEISTGTGDHDICFRIVQTEPDMAVTIIDIPDSNYIFSLTTVLTRTKGPWKLHGIRVGTYRAFGKDAPDWFRIAEAEYNQAKDINSMLHMHLAYELLRPYGEYMTYVKEPAILALGGKIDTVVRDSYTFPKIAFAVKHSPVIYSISSMLYEKDIVPVIRMTTTLPFTDTVAISRCCDSVHAQLDQFFYKLNRTENLIYHVVNPKDTSYLTFVKHPLKKYWQYRD